MVRSIVEIYESQQGRSLKGFVLLCIVLVRSKQWSCLLQATVAVDGGQCLITDGPRYRAMGHQEHGATSGHPALCRPVTGGCQVPRRPAVRRPQALCRSAPAAGLVSDV